jgi:hypothetical protein
MLLVIIANGLSYTILILVVLSPVFKEFGMHLAKKFVGLGNAGGLTVPQR